MAGANVIYDDDLSFGKDAPSISSLKLVKGSAAPYSEKATLVFFWSKVSKDEYVTFVDLSKVQDKFPELQVIGVSLDNTEDDVAGYAKKIGASMPELDVASLDISYALAFDDGKSAKKAFQTVAGLLSIGAGQAFLINKEGKIVWRENFNRTFFPSKKGQLVEQIELVLAGKAPVYKNGNKPKVEDDDEDEEEMDMGDADDMFGI